MNDLRAAKFDEIFASIRGNRLAVYDALYTAGKNGVTGTELAEAMGWTVLSVRPRLCELRKAFLAEETGERRDGEHVFRFVPRHIAEERHRAAQEPQDVEPFPTTDESAAETRQLSLF